MRSFWEEYVKKPFLRAVRELPWFGPVISGVLAALLVNLVTETLSASGHLWLGWVATGLLALVTVAFIYAYHISQSRRLTLNPIDLPQPERHRGMIFLFSQEETLRAAIQYHQPVLEYCWLLVTEEMQEEAQKMPEHFPDIRIVLCPLKHRYDTQGCYQIVRQIYREEAPMLGIPPQEVISDITGGTKPMTMGMIVACLEGNYPIQHVPAEFDPVTREPSRTLPPAQIQVRQGVELFPPGERG